MELSIIDPVFASILIMELVAFHFFYTSGTGAAAVYCAWYAPLIDFLAVISGGTIMTLAIVAAHHPELFTVAVPLKLTLFVFIIGSWQTCVHGIKWAIRIRAQKETARG